jgi:hypothetical protein
LIWQRTNEIVVGIQMPIENIQDDIFPLLRRLIPQGLVLDDDATLPKIQTKCPGILRWVALMRKIYRNETTLVAL